MYLFQQKKRKLLYPETIQPAIVTTVVSKALCFSKYFVAKWIVTTAFVACIDIEIL